MDDDRFDSWTRKIAASTSRRSIVKGIAGAFAGAILGSSRASETDAASGYLHRGQRCGMSTAPCASCLVCMDGRCEAVSEDSHCSDTECGVCRNGICRPDQNRCHGCDHCTSGLTCKSTCDGDDQVCCDGSCRPRGTCCQENNDCERCQMCDNGQCVTDPHQAGKQCSSCKVCENGSCSKEDPDLYCHGVCCEEGQVCAGHIFKECCDVPNVCNGLVSQDCCTNGNVCTQSDGCCLAANACGASDGAYGHGQHKECCAEDELCISGVCCPHDRSCGDRCCADGSVCHVSSEKSDCCKACGDTACCDPTVCVTDGDFCCDTKVNQKCGDNGDGTFKQCCSGLNEECCGDKCVPKGCCDQNQNTFMAASDVCCEEGHIACNGECCDTGQQCCGGYCCSGPCDTAGADCCPSDQTCGDTCCDGPCDATGSSCCPADQVCGDSCCDSGLQCCNGSCQAICGDCDPGEVACDMTSTSYGAIMCCGAGTQCCPGNLLWYCGPNPENGLCCQAGEEECNTACCAPGQYCDLGICCDQGQEACAFDGKAVCCNAGQVCRYDGPSAPYCA